MYQTYKLKYFFIIATLITALSVVALLLQFESVLKTTNDKTIGIEKANIRVFSKNIENKISSYLGDYANNPLEISNELSVFPNSLLSAFSSKKYPNIFVLSKDHNDIYRYIFSSSKHKKLSKFTQNADWLYEVWYSKKPMFKIKNKSDKIQLIYLYPFVKNDEIKMILFFESNPQNYKLLKTTLLPVKDYILYLGILIIAFFFLALFIVALFYTKRHKLYVDSLTKLNSVNYLSKISNNIPLKHFAIALIDVDHFKRINDVYGYDVGDLVLKHISKVLNKIKKPNDIVIRYGGEKFLLLIYKKTVNENKIKEIKDIQGALSQEKIDDTPIRSTVSIGFNTQPHLHRSLNDAIDIADKMLYKAKTSGRNRVEVYEEEFDDSHIYVIKDIQEAIEEGRIVTYYQPILEVAENKVTKYEALIRMRDKDENILSPISFLPHIKSNNAYRSMSKFVLESSIKMIEKHYVSININFNLGDFSDDTLFELIYDTIYQKASLASKLTIELLEDQEVKDFAKINKQISKLQNLGVSIAIDDFGTGYSTFSYLLALNPNILKIDGFLISKIDKNLQAKSIVASIVNLCKSLNIKVVAEFVANEKIKEEAINLGIDYLQGYVIGKPSEDIS